MRWLALAVVVLVGVAAGAADAVADTLTVRITGFAAIEGDVHAALYDDAEAFPEPGRMLAEKEVWLAGPVAEIAFSGLTAGRRYAVAVYHDANGNHEFDQAIFGIPLERYGFSRNAPVFLGPPGFDAAAVTLPAGGLTIEIDLTK